MAVAAMSVAIFLILCSIAVGQSQDDICWQTDYTGAPIADCGPPEIQYRESNPGEDWRLPDYVTPIFYDVTIKPNISTPKPELSGEVTIKFKTTLKTSVIRLHSERLSVQTVELYRADNRRRIHITKVDLVTNFQQMWLVVPNSIQPDVNYTVHINYTGEIEITVPSNKRRAHEDQGVQGVYLDTYVDQGEQKYVIATHFTPVGARRAFPCFDEPRFKAVFRISVWRKSTNSVLSNMPVSYSDSKGDVLDHFMPTPIMSTYLVAFAVSEFTFVEHRRMNGVPIRIWTYNDNLDSVQLPLKLADPLMSYFEKYTGIPYELPKLDILCLPDHPDTFMENWGLLIVNQTTLHFDPEESTAEQQLEMTLSLAQGICHLWYGNLVTPEWWSDLWIKEGICTYLMNEASAALYPNWNLDHVFLTQATYSLMSTDHGLGRTAVITEIDSQDDFKSILKQQLFSKGACIIKTLKYIVGAKHFDVLMKRLVTENMYGSVNTSTILMLFSEHVENETLQAFLTTWLNEPGYPYIIVAHHGNDVTLTQQRYTNMISLFSYVNAGNFTWRIPVAMTTHEPVTNTSWESMQWMSQDEVTFHLPASLSGSDILLFVNANSHGYFRTMYEEGVWQNITKYMLKNHTLFPVVSRAHLINDAFEFSGYRYLKESVSLELAQYLKTETDDLPWKAFLDNIPWVTIFITHTDMLEGYRKMAVRLIEQKYEEIGWKFDQEESILRRMVRHQVLENSCQVQYVPCLKHTRDEFLRWRQEDNYRLHPETAGTIMCYGVQQGDASDWQSVFNAAQTVSEPLLSDYKQALLCSHNTTLLHWFLNHTLESGQFGKWVSQSLLFTKAGKTAGWEFIQHAWSNPGHRGKLSHFLVALCKVFSSEEDLAEMERFVERNNFDLAVHIAHAMAEEANKWLKMNRESLIALLNKLTADKTSSAGRSDNRWLATSVLLLAFSYWFG